MNSQSFSIDFRSGIPVYVQIVEQVQAHLAQGRLVPGDQLPTVRQLASELRVNFNTVARAYRILDDAGLISTQQGRGTYILERNDEEHSRTLKTRSLKDQIAEFVAVLRLQGFQPEEVSACLHEALDTWDFDDRTGQSGINSKGEE